MDKNSGKHNGDVWVYVEVWALAVAVVAVIVFWVIANPGDQGSDLANEEICNDISIALYGLH